jgi:hypothetical protein
MDFLNNELSSLQSDYLNFQQQQSTVNQINFQDPTMGNKLNTEQIKRVTKSGDHRIEFNDRLNQHNMLNIHPEKAPNFMEQFSMQTNQSNTLSEYMNPEMYNNNNKQIMYNYQFQQLHPQQQTQQTQTQTQSQYQHPQYQHPQYQHPQYQHSQYQQSNSQLQFQQQQQQQQQLQKQIQLNQEENPNVRKYHEFGYNKIDDLKTDHRQNMNNKIDNIIFDNVGFQFPPLIQPSHDFGNSIYGIDNRLQLQENSRSLYKDQANERMLQYSPLSRAANIPISQFSQQPNQPNASRDNNTKELLSNRMNQFAPLSRTVALDTNMNAVSGQNNSAYKQQIYDMNKTMQKI